MEETSTAKQTQRFEYVWPEELAPAYKTPYFTQRLLKQWQKVLERFRYYLDRLQRLSRRKRRVIQRAMGTTIVGVALGLALGGAPAVEAADITVGGGCTLVDALTAANTDTATGSCTAGSGADNIILAGGTYTLTAVNNTAGDGYGNGLPLINTEITIQGAGSTIERSGAAPEFRIFEVGNGGNLTLDEVTIQGGAISSSVPDAPEIHGGGILVTSGGSLTVRNSTITGNTVTNASTTGGPGVYRYASGGGISAYGGSVTIENSTFNNNTAVSASSYAVGAGLSARYSGSINANNCTLTGNLADSGTNAGGGGGGAFVGMNDSSLTLTHCTITGNESRTSGGSYENGAGVYAYAYAGATLSLDITNTIITGNTGDNDCSTTSNGTVNYTTTSSLISINDTPGGCGGTVPTNLNLGTLADNGGPTQTIALLAGSTDAVDQIAPGTGGCVSGTSVDQRGAARAGGPNQGDAACDIGAFEFASTETPTAVTMQDAAASQENSETVPLLLALFLTLSTGWIALRRRLSRLPNES